MLQQQRFSIEGVGKEGNVNESEVTRYIETYMRIKGYLPVHGSEDFTYRGDFWEYEVYGVLDDGVPYDYVTIEDLKKWSTQRDSSETF